jgi:hypothetical protein
MNILLSCSLLKKKWKPQEIKPARRQFQWNQLDPEYQLDPTAGQVDDRAIFRLHWGVELEEEDDTHIQEMMEHVEDLRSKVSRYGMKQLLVQFLFSALSPHPHPFRNSFLCCLNSPIFCGIEILDNILLHFATL